MELVDRFLKRLEKKSRGVALSIFNGLNDDEKSFAANKSRKGKIMLHVYCKHATYDTIKDISKYTCMIDHLDNKSQTPLFVAVERGNIEASRALLERGADVNYCRPSRNYYGYKTRMWPLRTAIMSGNLEMVRLLIQFKVNLEVRDDIQETDHLLACKSGNKEIMYLLAQHLVDCNMVIGGYNESKKTYLHYAVKTRNYELVDLLLSKGVNPNSVSHPHRGKGSKTAFVLAIENEDYEMVKKLAKGGAYINLNFYYRFHAMTIAILMRNVKMVRLCLALGQEVSTRDVKYVCKFNLYDIGVLIACEAINWYWVLGTYFISEPKTRKMQVLYYFTGLTMNYAWKDITLFETIDYYLQIQREREKISSLKKQLKLAQ